MSSVVGNLHIGGKLTVEAPSSAEVEHMSHFVKQTEVPVVDVQLIAGVEHTQVAGCVVQIKGDHVPSAVNVAEIGLALIDTNHDGFVGQVVGQLVVGIVCHLHIVGQLF